MKLSALSLSAKTALMVIAALGALTLAVMAVAAVLLTRDAAARAAERQETNMRVAWDVLADYGDGFTAREPSSLTTLVVTRRSPRKTVAVPPTRVFTRSTGAVKSFIGVEPT